MDIEEPAFEITSSVPFACHECKKHEAMSTDLKKENEALRKKKAEVKAEKSLTNFSYDSISLKEHIFKSLIGLPKTSFDTGEHCEKLMFYDPSRRANDIVSPGRSEQNKRGRKAKMLPADQSVIYVPCVVKKWFKFGLYKLVI